MRGLDRGSTDQSHSETHTEEHFSTGIIYSNTDKTVQEGRLTADNMPTLLRVGHWLEEKDMLN